jgi:hypothetical protein
MNCKVWRTEMALVIKCSYESCVKVVNKSSIQSKTPSRIIRSRDNMNLSFIHSSMVLQPFVGPWPLLQFHYLFYTDGWTPWTNDQPVVRPLPTHMTTQTQNKRTHRYPCIERDSDSRSQPSRELKQFMPWPARPPGSVI